MQLLNFIFGDHFVLLRCQKVIKEYFFVQDPVSTILANFTVISLDLLLVRVIVVTTMLNYS